MKIFVVHDHEGNIISLAVPGPGNDDGFGVEPEPGEFVSEVEAKMELSFDDDESIYEQLRDIVENFRVEFLPQRPKLVRRRE